MKPKIGITMGDAAGISPEITIKSFLDARVREACDALVLGSRNVLDKYIEMFRIDLVTRAIASVDEALFELGVVDVIDYDDIELDRLRFGEVSAMCGAAAVRYTQEAGKLCLGTHLNAMVSAPLNKESMRMAGFRFEGATQILGELTGSKRYSMMLILGNLRLVLATTHMSLRKAIDLITRDRILNLIELSQETLLFLGIEQPKIAVAALNPHAGEGGIFGSEEIEHISPAIKQAVSRGIDAVGPVPADVVFVKGKNGDYDAIIALTHDQGTMAIKLLGFGEAVTLLAGIPIIRTSVGHGTAFDIAWKNIADHRNLTEAILTAADLAMRRMKA